MTILWPVHVLRPQNVAFDIAPRSLAGPSSVSGFSQVVASDAGIWKARLGSVIVSRRNHVLAWRAIDALLEGRLNPILVPLCRAYQPVPADFVDDDVPHSDDAPFDDETEYDGSVISVFLAADMAVRAVSGSVNIAYAGTLQPGQHFSLGERLYRLRTVTYTGANTADITFRPPLREAAAVGAVLEFDNPVCRMRLVSDQEMNLELAGRRRSAPTVNFIEDI